MGLPGGKEKPKIHVKQIGYANVEQVSEEFLEVGVDLVLPNFGAFGAEVTLEGFGFPLDEDTDFKITICEN